MSSRAKPCWRSENSSPLSEVSSRIVAARARVALEEVERVGAVHHQAGADITVAIDVELDVDAAELRRIDLEMLVAGVGLRRDLDGEAGQRHGGGLRWGLRLRRDICGRCRRVGGRCELKILHRVGAGLDRTAGVATLLRGCARFRLRQAIGYHSMEFGRPCRRCCSPDRP